MDKDSLKEYWRINTKKQRENNKQFSVLIPEELMNKLNIFLKNHNKPKRQWLIEKIKNDIENKK